MAGTAIEQDIVNSLVFDGDYAKSVVPHLVPEYFSDDGMRDIIKIGCAYFTRYHAQPTREALAIELQSASGLSQTQFDGAKSIIQAIDRPTSDHQWRVDKAEEFCQDRALYLAVLKAVKVIDKESQGSDRRSISKGELPHILQEALGVSFDRSIGHDYINDADARFDFYNAGGERVPFDIEMLNRITGGGLFSKTLTIWTAAPGTGKTTFMCHMAAANMMSGRNVLYITMEMAQEFIAMRIDANLLDIPLSEIQNTSKEKFSSRIDDIKRRTKADIIVKEFPTGGASADNFRHLLVELEQKKNFKPDVIYVDYMNICASARYRGQTGVNSYNTVKSIGEELRSLAVEFDVPLITATQLNRQGAGSSDPDMTDTSDSFGTPMVADLQLAIYSTPELEQDGKIMVKQLKNRYNGTAANLKFILNIDRDRMKLSDSESFSPDFTHTDNTVVKTNDSSSKSFQTFDFTESGE
jgi:replicative DNA helicase